MKIKLGADDRINLLMVAFISFYVWVLSFNGILYLPVFGVGLATYLYVLSYAAVIMCALPVILKRINHTDIIILISVFIILICSYLLFPDTHTRMSERIIYFFQALPWLFVGRCVTDYSKLLLWFEKAARITIIIGALYYLVRIIGFYDNSYNNMVYAYNFLPSCIIAAYGLIRNIDLKNIIFNVIGISVLILCGCRGAILCFGVAVLIFIYFFSDKRWYKIAAALVFAAAAILYMSDYFYTVLMSINRWMHAMGIDNRIFRQILLDEFTDGSGRGSIAKQVFSGIAERPFTGYGLYGDTTLNMKGTYSHNIILELMASFGMPLGLMLFLIFTVCFVQIVISKQCSIEYKVVLIIFFCSGMVKLFMSGSFMEEPFLCMLIGMMAGYKKIIRNENTNVFYNRKNNNPIEQLQ